MAKRYEVEKTKETINESTEVWLVHDRQGTGDERAAWDYTTAVWRSADGACQCTRCSGQLQAMLSSCPHAKAVKRAARGVAVDGQQTFSRASTAAPSSEPPIPAAVGRKALEDLMALVDDYASVCNGLGNATGQGRADLVPKLMERKANARASITELTQALTPRAEEGKEGL